MKAPGCPCAQPRFRGCAGAAVRLRWALQSRGIPDLAAGGIWLPAVFGSSPPCSPGAGSSIPTSPPFLSPAASAPLTLCGPFSPDAFEHHHVAQLLRRFSSDCATNRNVALDAALAHHLQQCSYHLRLFRSWLISGQDDLDCLYGTARRSCLGPLLL